MKLASKFIAVSALAGVLATPAAFAQIPRATDPAGSGVYVGVWDLTKNVSIVQYLGFQEQNTAGVALGTTWNLTNWSALSGSSTSNLVFLVSGSDSNAPASVVTTGPQSGLGAVNNGNVVGMVPLIDNVLLAVNNDCGTVSCVSDSSTSLHLASFAGQNGQNYTNQLPHANATGAVGVDALAWYFASKAGIPAGNPASVNEIGTGVWTLSADGVLMYAAPSSVPLPAAVWLLLSGLAGVATVGRRKTPAAA
jgi:hypothetical protein